MSLNRAKASDLNWFPKRLDNEKILEENETDIPRIIERMSMGNFECQQLLTTFSTIKKHTASQHEFFGSLRLVSCPGSFIEAMKKLDQLGIRGRLICECFFREYDHGVGIKANTYYCGWNFHEAIMADEGEGELVLLALKIINGLAKPRPEHKLIATKDMPERKEEIDLRKEEERKQERESRRERLENQNNKPKNDNDLFYNLGY